jgi:hypothetical protein
MTLRVSTYCQTCGVKFEYNADTGSDYYHGVSATCPNGHGVCCLPDKVDIDIQKATDARSES